MINYGVVKIGSRKQLCFLVSYRNIKNILFVKSKEDYIYPTIKLRKKGILLIYDFSFCTFEGENFIYNNKVHKLFLPI